MEKKGRKEDSDQMDSLMKQAFVVAWVTYSHSVLGISAAICLSFTHEHLLLLYTCTEC